MDKAGADLQKRLYASAFAVLLVGLCSAALIYFTARDDADIDGAYQVVSADGKVYPIAPGDSKMYVHELQRFGGKAAVLFDEIDRWFAGLWHGKALARTVGWMSVFLSLGLYLFAGYISPQDSRAGDTGRRDEPPQC